MKHLYPATEKAVLENTTELMEMALKERSELIQIISENNGLIEYKLQDKDPEKFWKVIIKSNLINKVYQIFNGETSNCDFDKLNNNACNFISYLGKILYS